MKGIYHFWCRGRYFSPSLPGDRYLKLGSQKRSPGRSLGEHCSVRHSGTASRGTVVVVFPLRMRRLPRTHVLPCIRQLRPQYERQLKIRCPTETTRSQPFSSQLTKLKTVSKLMWPLQVVNLKISGLI